MYVSEKIAGGKLLAIELETKNNKISKIQITGDFFLHPEEQILELEKLLIGIQENISYQKLDSKISMGLKNCLLVGASSSDIAKLILSAIEKEKQRDYK